ncbi:DUF554 domain-containing protein [Bacillus sp. FJAT-42376]|uniref:DUF554 domain-containing protein n=1 Tax=Bacillus sp. FJAT-42376 TaxID=2014076 RepID=UPI000F4F2748|nr:DUF554 domain-containing protein [Bacillus sp. FJAT-42376]AZB44699.1 DUF554 domain-containing protein [Bacillus sp. FJAT-42376]
MVLLGSVINAIGIAAGTLIGLLLTRIPERIKETVMIAIGLSVSILGITMALKSEDFFYVIVSLIAGAVIGEILNLEEKLHAAGRWIEGKTGKSKTGNIAEGFVTATLIFVIGAMSIVGALDSGLRGDHSVLMTKSMIDGFTSAVLASTLGIGVMLSAIPVFLYEGAIALFAGVIQSSIEKKLLTALISELTAAGGVMILAIGLNMLQIKSIRVANLLPALPVIILLVTIQHYFF